MGRDGYGWEVGRVRSVVVSTGIWGLGINRFWQF